MTPARRIAAAAALLVALAYGAWLRIPFAKKPATSDEIAIVDSGGAREIALRSETRSNPPLHRWMVNLPFDRSHTRWRAGQVLSWISTGIAAALAFSLAMRLAGGSIVAGIAGALMALENPRMLEESTRFRSYAPWLAVALWQWHALARLLEGKSRGARFEFAAASMLLPWLHYTSAILLAAEAIALAAMRRWRAIALFIPAAVAMLPLVWLYQGAPAGGIPRPQGESMQLVRELAAAGLGPMRELGMLAHHGVRSFSVHLTIVVPIAIAIVLFAWRRMPPLARAAVITYLLFLTGLTMLGGYRLVRPPGALWLLPPLLVVFVAAPLLVRAPAVRAVIYAAYALAIVVGVEITPRPELAEGVSAVAKRWGEINAQAGGRPVHVIPDYAAHLLLFELQGIVVRELPRDPRCEEGQLCWQEGDLRVIGGMPREWPRDAFIVAFHEPMQEPPPLPCPSTRAHAFAVVADCRNGVLP